MTIPGLMVEPIPIALEDMREQWANLRIVQPALEERMRRSLEREGQLTPVTLWRHENRLELLDGFKRLRAARRIRSFSRLMARVVEGTVVQARPAMLLLNRPAGGLTAVEEGWIIRALIREDRQSQAEVASLLARTQSWVSRRLSLVERLVDEAQEQVRLGLLAPTLARALAVMPRGIQPDLLAAVHREGLTTRETVELTRLLAKAPALGHASLLANPRGALAAAVTPMTPVRDPRLGPEAAQLDSQIRRVTGWCNRLGLDLDRTDFLSMTSLERTLLMERLETLYRELLQVVRLVMRRREEHTRGPTPSKSSASPGAPISRTSSPTCTEPALPSATSPADSMSLAS
jgi:ParB family chromosome partitioning protein